MLRLSGKKVIITGASSGLGAHFAETCASHGATVALLARRQERLEEVRNSLATKYPAAPPAVVHACDLSQGQDAVHAAIRAAVDKLGGRCDVVVNNAGVGHGGRLLTMKEEDWDTVFDINTKGVWLVAQAAAKAMIEDGGSNGGSIINIASVAATTVLPGLGAYCSSKAAVVSLTQSMALEWARNDIRVNAICPGYFRTEMNAAVLDSKSGQKLSQKTPLGQRFGRHEELDGALLLLAGDESSYMTGTCIAIDGGLGMPKL
jgi:NAD(P)-dependent dehydrogenase (short-subunit alcohol dehydrogenase family)